MSMSMHMHMDIDVHVHVHVHVVGPMLHTTLAASHPCRPTRRLHLYLCATPSGTCDEDEDLSDYYGQPVYVCY